MTGHKSTQGPPAAWRLPAMPTGAVVVQQEGGLWCQAGGCVRLGAGMVVAAAPVMHKVLPAGLVQRERACGSAQSVQISRAAGAPVLRSFNAARLA